MSATPTMLTPGERYRAGQWRPSRAGATARLVVLALLVLLLLAIPHLVPPTLVTIVMRAAIFAVVALSMNVLMGYAGQVSLGHAAFFGIGAFFSGVMVTDVGLPFGAGFLVAGFSGAATALILGGIALRLKGLYLALVTIAYGSLAELTLFKLGIFNGGAGVDAPRPALFSSDLSYAYLCYAVLAVALAFDWRLTATKTGRAIQALRDDERVAASWGINVTSYKLLAFVISGTLAGFGGSLFAHIFEGVSSVQFGFFLSLTFVLMTVVGGLGNRWGVVQGGIVFAALPTLLDEVHEAWHIWPFTAIDALWEPLIGAVLLILTLIFFPGGIAQQQEDLLRWLSFGRFHGDDHGEGDAVAQDDGAAVGAEQEEPS